MLHSGSLGRCVTRTSLLTRRSAPLRALGALGAQCLLSVPPTVAPEDCRRRHVLSAAVVRSNYHGYLQARAV